MRLGKLPARMDAVKLKLAHYLDTTALPPAPPNFGHENTFRNWQMLANDRYGCCVWSGAAHETMLWAGANRHAGAVLRFRCAVGLFGRNRVPCDSQFHRRLL
ncbi:hypothetical protein [Nocardia sp. NPDC051570]|uniref:hypothetical protein n=1 Tax=Nocardia sp. NPDC051570 TaxID=3364324 RepID=UPI0037AA2C2D